MAKFDVIADWALNKVCNFSCPYCFVPAKEKRETAKKGHDVQEIVSAFDNSGKIWLVHMSGGEPFLHPDFIGLCKGLTEKHYISVNTNLSSSLVYDFCDHIDPEKVSFVHCSLHIIEREKKNLVNDFMEKVKVAPKGGMINSEEAKKMTRENLAKLLLMQSAGKAAQ